MLALVVVTFVIVTAVVLGAYWLFVVRLETGEHRALQKRLRAHEAVAKGKQSLTKKTEQRDQTVSFKWLQTVIDQSGRETTVPKVLFTCFLAGFVTGVVIWALSRQPIPAAIAGFVAALAPYFLLRRAASKRMFKFEEQFPDAIDLIARALRAGHAFPPGLAMVAEELGDPVGPEFKLLYNSQNFGMPLNDAMRSFAARVPIIDARFFVTAVLMQREAGGNLSGVLDNLSSVIRERFKVKRQVSVISAHGRMTAIILSLLPVAIGLIQGLIARQNMALLFGDPLGRGMLAGAAVLQLLGMLWIRKIIRIEY
jgi:tight adherence protein B